jgi:hypothetical protein
VFFKRKNQENAARIHLGGIGGGGGAGLISFSCKKHRSQPFFFGGLLILRDVPGTYDEQPVYY